MLSFSAKSILVVLLNHSPWADRAVPPEVKVVGMAYVAQAIYDAARTDTEAASLITLGLKESGYRISVVFDGCRGLGARACDSGKARGAWQPHKESCPAVWALPIGSVESIRAEAECAMAQLRGHAWRCRDHASNPLEGAFSGYATGGACHWVGAAGRVETARRIVKELRAVGAHATESF
jgi:hypothetical protein